MNLILMVTLVGNLTITSYRSIPSQTDNSPFNTSTGEHVSISGAAVSQDRLCGACRKLHKRCQHPEYLSKVHYGDCLFIEAVGFRIVNDCMGKRKHFNVVTKTGIEQRFINQTNWLDIWVGSYADEHSFHKQNGIKQNRVWKVEEKRETH